MRQKILLQAILFCGLASAILFINSCDLPYSRAGANSHATSLHISVTASPVSAGAVSMDPDKTLFDFGEPVRLTAQAFPGYEFDHWEGAAQGLMPELTIVAADTVSITAVFRSLSWTVLVYMAADNDLESQAIADLNEMETVDLGQSGVKILALVDRGPGFDTSNGDWTDTRLYEVRHDSGGMNLALSSLLLAREDPDFAGPELDMGDPATLSAFVRFAKAGYPAKNYGIVLWGHGSGWRGGTQALTRAIGFDDSSADFLYTSELGRGLSAISGGPVPDKWAFVAADLCDGAMLEIAYQLKDLGDYYVASEDLVSASGWDYGAVVSDIKAAAVANGPDGRRTLALSMAGDFARTYAAQAGATCSVIQLDQVDEIFEAWNQWSLALRDSLATSAQRDELRDLLFNDVEDFYQVPGDLNIDLRDAAVTVLGKFGANSSIRAACERVIDAIAAAVPFSFAQTQGNPRAGGLAVHLVRLDSHGGIDRPAHDPAYFRFSTAQNVPAFVNASFWVPSSDGTGLLDRLWYEVF